MNLCVAYSQTGKTKKSEATCTAEINSAEAINSHNEKALYLKSLSYNNRGVSRYKNNDISGALADLNVAVLIDPNDITISNLSTVKQYLNKPATDTSAIFAD